MRACTRSEMAEAKAEQTQPQTQPKVQPTALALLLASGEEASTEAIIDAMLNGSGMVLSTGEVRRYLQASGKKVKKVADGILAIGVNVAFMRTLHQAVKGTGATIGLGDALVVVKSEFGVDIPPQVIKVLELASS